MISRLTPEREAEIRDAPPDRLFSPMLEDLLAEIDALRDALKAEEQELMAEQVEALKQHTRAEKAEAEIHALRAERDRLQLAQKVHSDR